MIYIEDIEEICNKHAFDIHEWYGRKGDPDTSNGCWSELMAYINKNIHNGEDATFEIKTILDDIVTHDGKLFRVNNFSPYEK